jgi:heptaprenyl diphosphate synthase
MTPLHNNRNRTQTLALLGLLVAAAFVLSWIEAQVPAFFAVPGMKLGLTNLVVLMALYRLGPANAFALNFLRILLAGFTFGNLMSMGYSMAGGMLSCLVMVLLYRSGRFHMVTVSVAGGIFHNVGQILVAMMVLESGYVLYYLPVLWAAGLAAGAVIGLLCAQVVRRLPKDL